MLQKTKQVKTATMQSNKGSTPTFAANFKRN